MPSPADLGYTRRPLARISDMLRVAFGRRPDSAERREGRALALLDLHPHTRGGHFGAWLRWFATELASRFDEVLVVTPSPRETRALFAADGCERPKITFHRLPRRLRSRLDLEVLRDLEGARRRNLAAFVMWGYDLVALRPASSPSTVPWGALGGVSWLARTDGQGAADLERQLQALFDGSPAFRAFVHPDAYVAARFPKGIVVPDIEDVGLPPAVTERARRIRAHAGGRFSVGAFGMISGYRCLDELLPLAQVQPEVRFVVAGKIAMPTVAPELRHLLEPGALPNLLVLPGFIPTEEELNEAIAAVDALFVDGRRYPVQSGIVVKGVHFGRCVLTPRSCSWTSDFVAEHGVGITYADRTEALADAFARWRADGGEARSRRASAAVRNPRDVAASFDRLVRELQRGGEAPVT